MAKLRILHIGKYYEPFKGGIETFLRDLVECQTTQQRCEVAVLAHHHQTSEPTRTEQINGVSVTRVKLWRRLVFAPICPSFLSTLNQTIEKHQPELLHIHMPNLSAFACLISKPARRLPWVIHWHADVLGSAPDWRVKMLYPFYRIFEKALLKHAATIICTSPPYLESSQALEGYKHKCVVIPLGLREAEENAASISPSRQTALETTRQNLAERQQLKLLCIGRLTYYKGHDLLLRAIQAFPNIHLTIIGEGELQTTLERQIKALDLTKQVTLKRQVGSKVLAQEINRCDCICLPSIERTEAFGVVILEAARGGKPALVTTVKGSGMTWVVQHDITGWCVEPNSPHAIEVQLKALQEHPQTIHGCGAAAKKRFQQLFTIDSIAGHLGDHYRTALATRPKL